MTLEDLEDLEKRMERLEGAMDPEVRGERIREMERLVNLLNNQPNKQVFKRDYTGGFGYLLEASGEGKFLIFFIPGEKKFSVEGISSEEKLLQLDIDEFVDFLSMVPSNKKRDDYENFMKYSLAFLNQLISVEEERRKYTNAWEKLFKTS